MGRRIEGRRFGKVIFTEQKQNSQKHCQNAKLWNIIDNTAKKAVLIDLDLFRIEVYTEIQPNFYQIFPNQVFQRTYISS